MIPYFDPQAREEAYKTFQPDLVLVAGSWLDGVATIEDPLNHWLTVLPAIVSDKWVAPSHRDILNRLSLMVVPSNWVKSVFERDGVTQPSIEVIRESVDTNFFTPALHDQEVREWRNNHGISDSDVMLLVLGGEVKSKGGYEVIQAIKKLNQKNIKLVAKGWGTSEVTEKDKAYIAASGIADQVIYLEEILPREGVRLLYQACDIYAAPSHNEGFGRPHVEAQACGKPVITIDGNAAGENVKHQETGYVARVGERVTSLHEEVMDPVRHVILQQDFDPAIEIETLADSNDLAAGISYLLDPAVREKLGRQARQHAVTHFDTKVITHQLIEVINRVA